MVSAGHIADSCRMLQGNPELRQLLPLSLSYDHRVINGADAARFVCAIAQALEEFEF